MVNEGELNTVSVTSNPLALSPQFQWRSRNKHAGATASSVEPDKCTAANAGLLLGPALEPIGAGN